MTFPFPFFPVSSGGALSTLTRVGEASSSGATVTVPSVQSGDIILFASLLDSSTTGGTPSYTTPSGFTSMINGLAFANTVRMAVAAKRSDGTEGGSSIGGGSGADLNRKVCVVLRPDSNVISSIGAPQSVASVGATSNPSAQVVSSSGGTPPLLVVGYYALVTGGGSVIDPRTMSPAKDDEYNLGTGFYLAWKLYTSSPADVSVDMDDEGIQCLASCYFELQT